MDQLPEDFASALNRSRDGLAEAIGLMFVSATADEVVAELEVSERHRKADGTVDEVLIAYSSIRPPQLEQRSMPCVGKCQW